MNIFEKLRSGADVNMADSDYMEAIRHMTFCADTCFKINTTAPSPELIYSPVGGKAARKQPG